MHLLSVGKDQSEGFVASENEALQKMKNTKNYRSPHTLVFIP